MAGFFPRQMNWRRMGFDGIMGAKNGAERHDLQAKEGKQMTDVEVRETRLTLPAYREPPYEKLPMFAENRVHQRSSGNPYLNPVVVCVDRGDREENR